MREERQPEWIYVNKLVDGLSGYPFTDEMCGAVEHYKREKHRISVQDGRAGRCQETQDELHELFSEFKHLILKLDMENYQRNRVQYIPYSELITVSNVDYTLNETVSDYLIYQSKTEFVMVRKNRKGIPYTITLGLLGYTRQTKEQLIKLEQTFKRNPNNCQLTTETKSYQTGFMIGFKDGTWIKVQSLRAFCHSRGYDQSAMNRVLHGTRKRHKNVIYVSEC